MAGNPNQPDISVADHNPNFGRDDKGFSPPTSPYTAQHQARAMSPRLDTQAASGSKAGVVFRRAFGLPPAGTNYHDRVTRGESIAQSYSAPAFVDRDPTVTQWAKEQWPSRNGAVDFVQSLFPFTKWIHRYNTTWLIGDLVAGITIGAVVVPQSMAYAKLAQLPVEFGLYSSFMGVLIYWFFATSRDITIGPVAVMSQLTGNIVNHAADVLPDVPGHVIASALAVICGCIIFFLGFFRLGFIVDFIPLPAIAAFMTGSAVNIIAGQVPTLFGINKRFNTRAATYKVIIHTFQNLHAAKIDAAIGLTALVFLYGVRALFVQLGKRDRSRARIWFFASTLRTAVTILLYTLISYLVNRHHTKKPKFSLLGHVPRGFKHAAVPTINTSIIKAFSGDLASAVIVLLIEHIAIAKSFGRINGYTINPSQELIAIGITNIFGPFLGAYPATGSFSRTAIKSKAGVRTPFAGVITAVVVLMAIYALPSVFFYIPNAALSAVIIHAVGDLIVHPKVVYGFWKVSPLEVVIFFAGVIVTVFTTIEIGIYTTVGASGGLLLWRIARAEGQFLGRVKVRSVEGDGTTRYAYLPLDSDDGRNPELILETPAPGIFVYRFTDSLLYPNANGYGDQITQYIIASTKRNQNAPLVSAGDRPWNDPGPRGGEPVDAWANDSRPILKAIICDFSGVQNVDVTSVQALADIRGQLDRYAAPGHVEWHFANIRSPWVKRGLASVGFGNSATDAKPIFVVSEVAASQPSGRAGDVSDNRTEAPYTGIVPVYSVDRPLFHVDIDSAVRSAIVNTSDLGSSESGVRPSKRDSYASGSDRKSETAHLG